MTKRPEPGKLEALLVSRAARALASQISVCPHCHVLHYHPIGCRPAPTCASCGKPVTIEESHNEHRC